MPGAKGWAVVTESLGELEASVTYWERHLSYIEKLFAMGKVKSGGIDAEDLAKAIEQLALTLWEANRNEQAVRMYEQYRDIAKDQGLSCFDAAAEKTIEGMRADTGKA